MRVSILSVGFVALSVFVPLRGQQPEPADPGVTFRSGAREVLLDLVVRDKRGRAVRDLKPDEIRVYEDDIEQKVVSFRAVDAGSLTGGVNPSVAGTTLPSGEVVSETPADEVDPLRLNHLVSIVFHNLPTDARPFAYKAAADFLEKNLSDRVYAGVFSIGSTLQTAQPFTNNHDVLRSALRDAAESGFFSASAEAGSIAGNAQAQVTFNTPAAAGTDAGAGITPGQQTSTLALQTDIFSDILARIQSNTNIAMGLYDRVDRANRLVLALQALVDGQTALAGRKTILFFSSGFQLPVDSRWRFDRLVSDANRANVSFYAIDAVGLRATTPSIYQTSYLTAGGLPPGLVPSGYGRRLRPDDFTRMEEQIESITANPMGNLQELAVETGGRFIANTNNFSKPLERVVEDVLAYYELAYQPPPARGDGAYRQIRVEITRPKIEIQSRDGYFDMPEGASFDLAPHELPLLAALSSDPAPRDLAFRSRVLRFPGASQGSLVTEFPMEELRFRNVEGADRKQGRFSLLAQLKDDEGRIVRKASQDIPLNVPNENLEAVQRGSFTLNRTWTLAPGRYTLETVIQDRVGASIGTGKSVAIIQRAGDGPALSSLALIRRVDPVAEPTEDSGSNENEPPAAKDPFVCSVGKVIPSLADKISRQAADNISHYFVLYPANASEAEPELYIQYVKDGEVVGQSNPDLPNPQEDGSIPYIATAPAASFAPGNYLVNVVLKQGDVGVRERAFFAITD